MRCDLLLLLALGGHVAQLNAADAAPVAVIDVVVSDANGKPADTLAASDFQARGADGPISVESVRFVRTSGRRPPNEPAGASMTDERAITETSRLFAIYLDEYHTTPGADAERARAVLARFVRDELGPADFLVVLRPLDSLLQIRLTRDRDPALRALQAFDPRRGDFAPRSQAEQSLVAGAPARASTMRAQMAASAIDALVNHLGRFGSGRKTVIVLTEGFARARVHGSETDTLPTADSTLLAANRSHVAVYALDPRADPTRGSAPWSASDVDDGSDARARAALQRLVEGSAGRMTGPGGDLAGGLSRALEDASAYYLISLKDSDQRPDGLFHPAEISVRRTGLTTRSRSGYLTPVPQTVPAPPAAVAPALASRLVRRRSPLIEPWFGMSRAPDGATRISFVWEPAVQVPGGRPAQAVPARVMLTVTTLDGAPIFEGTVLPSHRRTTGQEPAQAWFEQPPAGRLLVQMAIQDEAARVIDRDVRDLVVGSFTGPVTIGSAEVVRTRSALEFRRAMADLSVAPVASRQFSRTDRLLIRVPVSSADTMTPLVTATLTSGAGAAMRELMVIVPQSAQAPFLVDVPLAGLAAGPYSVDLVARTRDGEARERLPVRVTP
jgi:VWFA-related protein